MTDETDLKQPERAQVFLQGESERFMKSLLEASTEPSSEIIYHYSGQEALLGILKSARIFASDLRFMNDHTERRFADRFIEPRHCAFLYCVACRGSEATEICKAYLACPN